VVIGLMAERISQQDSSLAANRKHNVSCLLKRLFQQVVMMNPAPLVEAAAPIPFHALAAFAAAALGAAQLWRPKGGRIHRQLGYLWVVLMAGVAISGLFIHEIRMFGWFSPIHLLSLLTLASLWVAISRARRRDIKGHRLVMILLFWLALGLTGIFTFWPGRVMHEVLFGA